MAINQLGTSSCVACGNSLRGGAKFCSRCGATQYTQMGPAAHASLSATIGSVNVNGRSTHWVWPLLTISLLIAISATIIYFAPEIGNFIYTIVIGIVNFIANLLTQIGEFIQIAFWTVVFILFFPPLFSFGMMVMGFVVDLFIAGAGTWMIRVGLWLLTQAWWWFPVGQIVGAIVIFSELFG